MANFGDISSNLNIIANSTFRRNASDTGFEVFTPTSKTDVETSLGLYSLKTDVESSLGLFSLKS